MHLIRGSRLSQCKEGAHNVRMHNERILARRSAVLRRTLVAVNVRIRPGMDHAQVDSCTTGGTYGPDLGPHPEMILVQVPLQRCCKCARALQEEEPIKEATDAAGNVGEHIDRAVVVRDE